MYYKIGMHDRTQFRIINLNSTFKLGAITSNHIYLNPNGQTLKYQNEKFGNEEFNS
ncbi:putative member of ShlA/HecA/FhaA exoprotein family [Acinetobacter haemolyticus]|uniref:Uncharacterized protein n=1 Tax=Acinetobacter haemolyticus CIP 64.3 = MTCC 9819 TaxID=1217659 RepID=N9F9E5_ACIHA|nr:hypothetical protein F927_01210 [Acinetobacter haemolyticus CIP 64.3 = MTCC 9819]SPT46685.1 putative member of ShlA/HecA/FhaA exoprotein family [Acinetobacter haemolyticus]SUU59537.1 putative member of ShlA/HecA/FhaA exoprotein family [Acinetobacter haemolyticus]